MLLAISMSSHSSTSTAPGSLAFWDAFLSEKFLKELVCRLTCISFHSFESAFEPFNRLSYPILSLSSKSF
jgi:hypothetical protein